MAALQFEALTGAALASALDDVARLRINVFRDFPYLYDGTLDYERDYLARFAAADSAIIVAARDGQQIVGAATGCSLVAEHEAFHAPLRAVGLAPEDFFYCAESVLLPEYRGQGAGHRFFDLREEQARMMGARHCTFCAVVRPVDHAARPAHYTPLDGFWRKRGYAPVDGLTTRFAWRDVGEHAETEKPMQFWMKSL